MKRWYKDKRQDGRKQETADTMSQDQSRQNPQNKKNRLSGWWKVKACFWRLGVFTAKSNRYHPKVDYYNASLLNLKF